MHTEPGRPWPGRSPRPQSVASSCSDGNTRSRGNRQRVSLWLSSIRQSSHSRDEEVVLLFAYESIRLATAGGTGASVRTTRWPRRWPVRWPLDRGRTLRNTREVACRIKTRHTVWGTGEGGATPTPIVGVAPPSPLRYRATSHVNERTGMPLNQAMHEPRPDTAPLAGA